jgi:type I restriction enzyme S subunit
MSNWKEYKLGELCTITSSKRIYSKEYVSEGVPFYRSKEVIEKAKGNEISTELFIANHRFKEIKNKFGVPLAGDILLTSVGTLGVSYQVQDNDYFYFKDGNLTWFREFSDNVNNKYLLYWLRSSLGKESFNNITIGSTQAALTIAGLKGIKLTLPNLPTQTAIAEILSSLDDKIELNRKINQELETLAQTLFKHWFIDFEFPNENEQPYKSSGGEMVDSELGEIPKGWDVGVLDDLIDFSNGNAFKSSELLNEPKNECYYVFKMGHIKKGGGLNADGTKSYFEKSKAQKLQKFVLRVGDLLMCMTDMKGNVALLGHTALMNENDKYIVNQRVGLLRPNNDIGIDYPYLYILTNSSAFIDELRSRANSGVQVNLSTSEIKLSKILLPPKEINISFDKIVKPFYDNIFNSINENRELTTLRDTLLPKLISGELQVSELVAQNA